MPQNIDTDWEQYYKSISESLKADNDIMEEFLVRFCQYWAEESDWIKLSKLHHEVVRYLYNKKED